MLNHRMTALVCGIFCVLVGASAFASGVTTASGSSSEQSLWDLEHTYWRYVENNDLSGYLSLWHNDFLGWPSFSNAPVRKDHITDWITSQTSKRLTFKVVEFKPAAMQVNADTAVACYWITSTWLDKEGKGTTRTLRVIHTWVKVGSAWQIIGGMSMQISAPPQ